MKVCIIEDGKYSNLFPLTYFRPVYDLRCGIKTLFQKFEHHFEGCTLYRKTRNYLSDVLKTEHKSSEPDIPEDGKILFINGRVIIDDEIKRILTNNTKEKIFTCNNQIVGALIKKPHIGNFYEIMNNFSLELPVIDVDTEEVDCRLIKYPWELILYNMEEIEKDFRLIKNGKKIFGKIYEGAVILNEEDVFIGENSIVKSNSVIDCEKGPVYIGKDVTIMPNSVIIGPAYIGDGSKIKPGAILRAGTNIGEFCKVGGEVYNSIMLSYSNKQYDGFLGNSYLSSWVNLGAGTTNSDLKNNYGNVRMWVNGELMDSGLKSIGAMIGDFTQTGINTTFNVGTTVGVLCNIFGEGFQPKFVSSFLWGGKTGFKEYNLEQGIKTINLVMKEYDKALSDEFKDLIFYVFNYTRNERDKQIRNKRAMLGFLK